jgi:hypothetical protein
MHSRIKCVLSLLLQVARAIAEDASDANSNSQSPDGMGAAAKYAQRHHGAVHVSGILPDHGAHRRPIASLRDKGMRDLMHVAHMSGDNPGKQTLREGECR